MSYRKKIDQILEKHIKKSKNVKYHIYMFDDYDQVNYYDICILYVWDLNLKKIYHYYKDVNNLSDKEFFYCGEYDENDFFENKNESNEYNIDETEFLYIN